MWCIEQRWQKKVGNTTPPNICPSRATRMSHALPGHHIYSSAKMQIQIQTKTFGIHVTTVITRKPNTCYLLASHNPYLDMHTKLLHFMTYAPAWWMWPLIEMMPIELMNWKVLYSILVKGEEEEPP